jgi:FlaA1/EpsC-like NDP-sugar epimerase
MIVADTAHRTGRPYVSVRFGNVLGSNGSVVPIFQQQLENGEAFTITDPEMTRFFMTIPEAAWLILDAAALAGPRDLFVLDMGEPVRVIDLARDLARLAGRDPESIPIKVVGLRKGEKLHEELFYDEEEVSPTAVPKVLRAEASLPRTDVRERAAELISMATGDRDVELAAALHEFVRHDITLTDGAVDAQQLGLGIDGGQRVKETNLVVVPIHSNGNGQAGPTVKTADSARRDADESELSTSGRRPNRS